MLTLTEGLSCVNFCFLSYGSVDLLNLLVLLSVLYQVHRTCYKENKIKIKPFNNGPGRIKC